MCFIVVNDYIILLFSCLYTYFYMYAQNYYKNVIERYGSTCVCLLRRDWAGLKWRPVLMVWEQLQDKHNEEMQNSYR